jgi:hypothetical protein
MLKLLGVGVVLVVAGLMVASCGHSRHSYEEAGFTAVSTDGDYEVRDYEEMSLVSAPMASEKRKNQNSAFMQLFRYIGGDNEDATKIPMTVPVYMESDGDESSMSFVMPADMAEVPKPESSDLVVERTEEERFASIRFSGKATEERCDAHEDKLRAWMAENDLEAVGVRRVAVYDGPFTLPSMRRNEILIRVGE